MAVTMVALFQWLRNSDEPPHVEEDREMERSSSTSLSLDLTTARTVLKNR